MLVSPSTKWSCRLSESRPGYQNAWSAREHGTPAGLNDTAIHSEPFTQGKIDVNTFSWPDPNGPEPAVHAADQTVGHHVTVKKAEYKVRWHGCGAEENPYEPATKLLSSVIPCYWAAGCRETESRPKHRYTRWEDRTNERGPLYLPCLELSEQRLP